MAPRQACRGLVSGCRRSEHGPGSRAAACTGRGRLFGAAMLRRSGATSGAHLSAVNLGLKTIPVDRRRHRDRETRRRAIAHSLLAAAAIGLKEHGRLALTRNMMERKLDGRRTLSRVPELVEMVMAKPWVSAGMVAKTLEVTPQAARRIVLELGLREMTGRFRALGCSIGTPKAL